MDKIQLPHGTVTRDLGKKMIKVTKIDGSNFSLRKEKFERLYVIAKEAKQEPKK